jgi:hypothetical protein
MPGFRSCYLLDGGPDLLITISRFDSADEAFASNEKAANWVRNNSGIHQRNGGRHSGRSGSEPVLGLPHDAASDGGLESTDREALLDIVGKRFTGKPWPRSGDMGATRRYMANLQRAMTRARRSVDFFAVA